MYQSIVWLVAIHITFQVPEMGTIKQILCDIWTLSPPSYCFLLRNKKLPTSQTKYRLSTKPQNLISPIQSVDNLSETTTNRKRGKATPMTLACTAPDLHPHSSLSCPCGITARPPFCWDCNLSKAEEPGLSMDEEKTLLPFSGLVEFITAELWWEQQTSAWFQRSPAAQCSGASSLTTGSLTVACSQRRGDRKGCTTPWTVA